jgi:histidinol phosphatase-like enzyme
MVKYSQLDDDSKSMVLPILREYFDKVTFEERNNWIMRIFYGHKQIFESFETYEFDLNLEEKAFEEKKLRLFLDGVSLYHFENNSIVLVCDGDNLDYYQYR